LTETDFTDITERGMIAHLIAELEIIKRDLLVLWEEFDENPEEEDYY
jgi:hypothetical protein